MAHFDTRAVGMQLLDQINDPHVDLGHSTGIATSSKTLSGLALNRDHSYC